MNKGIKAARAALKARREAGEKIVVLNPIEKARRKPTSRALAIRAECYDCVGARRNANTNRLIQECSVPECGLHHIRPYQATPPKGQQRLAEAIKNKCFMCVGGDADPGPRLRVRDCQIHDCPIYPVRPWQKIKGRSKRKEASA